jgi:hypothetical protein
VGVKPKQETGATSMRPMAFAEVSVNQTFPSGPAVIPAGFLPLASGKGVIAPPVVMRWTVSAAGPFPVNHRLPSGPAVMPLGSVSTGRAKGVAVPAVVIRPIVSAAPFVTNHRLPSGPAVMAPGSVP